jgi:hypothetical protein
MCGVCEVAGGCRGQPGGAVGRAVGGSLTATLTMSFSVLT